MDERDRNYRDLDDFFRASRSDDNKQQMQDRPQQKHTSYHYTYGPFKAPSHETELKKNEPLEMARTEVNYSAESSQAWQNGIGSGPQYHAPRTVKKSSFRAIFASFLVGILLMGGLMYVSDTMNWFDFIHGAEEAPSVTYGEDYFDRVGHSNVSNETAASAVIVRPNTIAEIAANASPAVVKVETMVNRNSGSFNNDFFRQFFGERFQMPQDDRLVPGGEGSGFIFEKNGYILTNEHVVSNAEEIYVTVEGYTEPFEAELLGSDYDLDLAVLKINGDADFRTIPIGNSADMKVGDWVTAIGNPMGFDHTVSVGVISAKERKISIAGSGGPTRNYDHLLQTDASINPGNSGGPLINLNGEVIGINTAVSTQAQGIGFAIPTSTIVAVLDQLKNNETIPKPYIGAWLADIDETWKENLKLDSTDGALVQQLESGSPASRAGLRPGDVIVKVGDVDIENGAKVVSVIGEYKVGDRVTIELIREGRKLEAVVIIGDRNEQ